jgi:hypothetical protein
MMSKMTPKHDIRRRKSDATGGGGSKNDPKKLDIIYGCSITVFALLYNLFVFQKPIKKWDIIVRSLI